MKNLHIMGVQQFLGEGGGGSRKTIYLGNCLKKGLGNLQKAWQKIRRRVFLGGVDTSMHTDLILVHAGT